MTFACHLPAVALLPSVLSPRPLGTSPGFNQLPEVVLRGTVSTKSVPRRYTVLLGRLALLA